MQQWQCIVTITVLLRPVGDLGRQQSRCIVVVLGFSISSDHGAAISNLDMIILPVIKFENIYKDISRVKSANLIFEYYTKYILDGFVSEEHPLCASPEFNINFRSQQSGQSICMEHRGLFKRLWNTKVHEARNPDQWSTGWWCWMGLESASFRCQAFQQGQSLALGRWGVMKWVGPCN